jgi:hypothetical protein
MGVPLGNNWRGDSELIRTIGKVKLFILDWYEIIITKIARAEIRDYEDIINIIEHQKLDFKSLKKKYYEIAETAIIGNYDEKFKLLESRIK